MYKSTNKIISNKEPISKVSKSVSFIDNRLKTTLQLKMGENKNEFISSKEIPWFIDNSSIHGQGVMAGKKLNKEEELGKVATLNEKNINITSNFGSLINHQSKKKANSKINKKGSDFFLKTERTIHQGEEITTDYDSAGPYFAKSKSNFKEV